MPRKPLSPRRRAVLDALHEWIRTHPYPPSVRQLAGALGRQSYGSVHRHLLALRADGWVTWDPNQARTIVLLDPDKPEETDHG